MTGLELPERMKGRKHSVPVIFISATDDPTLALKARKAGARDYLVKNYHYYARSRTTFMDMPDDCHPCVIA